MTFCRAEVPDDSAGVGPTASVYLLNNFAVHFSNIQVQVGLCIFVVCIVIVRHQPATERVICRAAFHATGVVLTIHSKNNY